MSMDFNDAEPQGTGSGSVIPDGTVAPVVINLKGIKASKSNNAVQGLDLEFTVSAGPYKGRKAFKWAGIKGTDSDGHKQMVNITRSFVRGVLESAYGVNPAADDDAAMNARRLGDWAELDGVEFVARFTVEAGTDFTDQRTGEVRKGKDKNDVRAVTPDDPDYSGFTPKKKGKAAIASKPSGNGAPQGGGSRPAWA